MREELKQIYHLLDSIQRINQHLKNNPINPSLRQDIIITVEAINEELYGCTKVLGMNMESAQGEEFCLQVEQWSSAVEEELHIREELNAKIDYDFHVLTQHIRFVEKEALVKEGVKNLSAFRQSSEENYQRVIRFYNHYSYFWGKIDLDCGIFDLLENRAGQLKEHLEDFIWLYGELADYRSKKVLYGIMHCWLTFDFEYKCSITENNFDDYWDFDILECNKDEVVVDVGAFTGDSTLSYIQNYGNYKKIYCYEITPESYNILQQNLSAYDNIVFRNVGAGDKNQVMNIVNDSSLELSGNRISEEAGSPVQIVRLDDDIREKITLLKMDIEGSELSALKGARGHIENDNPKLAICTYHNNHHIWEIPRWIKEVNPDYKLYMRYNGIMYACGTSEYVLFAI